MIDRELDPPEELEQNEPTYEEKRQQEIDDKVEFFYVKPQTLGQLFTAIDSLEKIGKELARTNGVKT
jgi:hypothetical protein